MNEDKQQQIEQWDKVDVVAKLGMLREHHADADQGEEGDFSFTASLTCKAASEAIQSLQQQLAECQKDKAELVECLQDIVREKELHGQVVDGTVAARELIAKHTADSREQRAGVTANPECSRALPNWVGLYGDHTSCEAYETAFVSLYTLWEQESPRRSLSKSPGANTEVTVYGVRRGWTRG